MTPLTPRGLISVAQCVVIALVLSSGRAEAEQELDFRTPAEGAPFFIVKPGGAQGIQVCATKQFLDQLLLWPGAPIVADLSWHSHKSGGWPTKDTLPRKITLIQGTWVDDNNKPKLCSDTVYAKHQDFPHPGYWDVAVSLQGTPKQFGTGTYTIGGGKRTLRVEAPTHKIGPPGNVKANPGAIVPPPPEDRQQSGQTGRRQPPTPGAPAGPQQLRAPQ